MTPGQSRGALEDECRAEAAMLKEAYREQDAISDRNRSLPVGEKNRRKKIERLPEHLAAVIRREHKLRWRLAKRSPTQWINIATKKLKGDPGVLVAALNVVWWDWFSCRSVRDRTPDFDYYLTVYRRLKGADNMMRGELVAALVALGYSPALAHNRLNTKDQKTWFFVPGMQPARPRGRPKKVFSANP